MSITGQYDRNYKFEPQSIDESSITEQDEIIEINDAVEQDPTENNSSDTEEIDDRKSKRNIVKFHRSKS